MASKSFRQSIESMNPAMQFIDVSAPAAPDVPAAQAQADPPDGYKLNPVYIEKRTRRLQLLIQPSLYNRLKKRAESTDLSMNELIHTILDDAVNAPSIK